MEYVPAWVDKKCFHLLVWVTLEWFICTDLTQRVFFDCYNLIAELIAFFSQNICRFFERFYLLGDFVRVLFLVVKAFAKMLLKVSNLLWVSIAILFKELEHFHSSQFTRLSNNIYRLVDPLELWLPDVHVSFDRIDKLFHYAKLDLFFYLRIMTSLCIFLSQVNFTNLEGFLYRFCL